MIQPANNPSHVAFSSEQPEIITVKRPKNVSFLVINHNKNSEYSPAAKALACIATGVLIGGLGVVTYKNWNTLRIPFVKLFTPGNQPIAHDPDDELHKETIRTLKSLQNYLDSQSGMDSSGVFTIIKVIAVVGIGVTAWLSPNSWLNQPLFARKVVNDLMPDMLI